MDREISGIILIVVGILIFIIRGLLGKGLSFGRQKWIYDKFGAGVARIVNMVIGAAIIVFGALLINNPELFAK